MVRWWCSANLKWWRTGREVRAMHNLLFYNMVCLYIRCVGGFPYLLKPAFALAATFSLENEGIVVKQYRPLN